MEEKTVKGLAIVLVLGVAAYAIYKIFENTKIAAIGATPGSTTANLASVPGVSSYPVTAPTVAAPAMIGAVAASTLSEYTPAFGTAGGNTSDEIGDTDYDDLDITTD